MTRIFLFFFFCFFILAIGGEEGCDSRIGFCQKCWIWGNWLARCNEKQMDSIISTSKQQSDPFVLYILEIFLRISAKVFVYPPPYTEELRTHLRDWGQLGQEEGVNTRSLKSRCTWMDPIISLSKQHSQIWIHLTSVSQKFSSGWRQKRSCPAS